MSENTDTFSSPFQIVQLSWEVHGLPPKVKTWKHKLLMYSFTTLLKSVKFQTSATLLFPKLQPQNLQRDNMTLIFKNPKC